MQRLDDWRPRVERYLQDCRTGRFAYGTLDCALFAAGAVQAMTGVDVAAQWRGQYRSARTGARLIGGDVTGCLEALATQILGPPIAAADATPGDIVSIDVTPGRAISLTLCLGDHVVAVQRNRGLVVLHPTRARRAWRV